MTDPIDRLLVRALRRPSTPPDSCPDADVLGAYALGGLGAEDRAAVEPHVSSCRRCAEHVAQLVALEDAEPVPPLRAVRQWPWLRWTWAVPAAVAVLVAAVWIAQPPSPEPARSMDAIERQARAPAAPVAGQSAPGSGLEARPEPPASQPGPSTKAKLPARRVAPATAGTRAPATPPPVDETVTVTTEAESLADAVDMSSPPARTRESAAANAAAPAEKEARADERKTEPPAASAPAPRKAARVGGRSGIAGFTQGSVSASIEVISPAPAVRWRVVPPAIQRSVDAGMTWHDDHAPVVPGIRFGAAVSSDACWFATENGTVLRRAGDGTWVISQAAEHMTVRGLHATSPLAAQLTASDGRVITTSDGGTTWTERP
jgi:hypothetical protein